LAQQPEPQPPNIEQMNQNRLTRVPVSDILVGLTIETHGLCAGDTAETLTPGGYF